METQLFFLQEEETEDTVADSHEIRIPEPSDIFEAVLMDVFEAVGRELQHPWKPSSV